MGSKLLTATVVASSLALAVSASAQSMNQRGQAGQGSQGATAQMGQGRGAPVYLGPEAVRQIQQKLKEQGQYDGQVDGIWGPNTKQAVRQFQQQHGMSATGNLSFATLQQMGISLDQLASSETGSGGQTAASPDRQPRSPQGSGPARGSGNMGTGGMGGGMGGGPGAGGGSPGAGGGR